MGGNDNVEVALFKTCYARVDVIAVAEGVADGSLCLPVSVEELYLPPVVVGSSIEMDYVAFGKRYLGECQRVFASRLCSVAELPVDRPCIEVNGTCPDDSVHLRVRSYVESVCYLSVGRDEANLCACATRLRQADDELVALGEDILHRGAVNLHASELVAIGYNESHGSTSL